MVQAVFLRGEALRRMNGIGVRHCLIPTSANPTDLQLRHKALGDVSLPGAAQLIRHQGELTPEKVRRPTFARSSGGQVTGTIFSESMIQFLCLPPHFFLIVLGSLFSPSDKFWVRTSPCGPESAVYSRCL